MILALAFTACSGTDSDLGRAIIECDVEFDGLTNTAIISAQAVPSSDVVPCINALRPGWEFQHVAPRSGRMWFAIDSDRLGDRFLEVAMTRTCDIGSAVPVASDEVPAELFVDVREDRSEAEVAVIPIAVRHRQYAQSVAEMLTGEIVDGFRIVARVDEADRPASERIAAAQARGVPILIIDDVEVATTTVSMRETNGDEESGLDLGEVVDELDDALGEPAYRATWFYVFGDSSCTRYDINATGPGAETVAGDIRGALGFYDLTELKEYAAEQDLEGAFE